MEEETFEIKIDGEPKEVVLTPIDGKIELKINELTGITEDNSLESLEELEGSELEILEDLEADSEDELFDEDDFGLDDSDDFELDDFDILD